MTLVCGLAVTILTIPVRTVTVWTVTVGVDAIALAIIAVIAVIAKTAVASVATIIDAIRALIWTVFVGPLLATSISRAFAAVAVGAVIAVVSIVIEPVATILAVVRAIIRTVWLAIWAGFALGTVEWTIGAVARVLRRTAILAAILSAVLIAIAIEAVEPFLPVSGRAITIRAILTLRALVVRPVLALGLVTPDGRRLSAVAVIGCGRVGLTVVAHVVATVVRVEARLAEALGLAARVLLELLAVGHDDAVVVLRVLEIVLRQHGVAGRLGVTCERHVLFRDVGGCAAHFHVRPVRLEAARERVLVFTVALCAVALTVALALAAITIAVAAAIVAPVMLLSWPHGRRCSLAALIDLVEFAAGLYFGWGC